MWNKSNFIFSAYKIQDYLECERRFELNHILKHPWPAIQSEPVYLLEQQMQQGEQFHLFAQQYFSNIQAKLIEEQIENDQMISWWQKFVAFAKDLLQFKHFAEYKISYNLNDFRLLAIYDLLVIDTNNKFTIIDWKTNKKRLGSNQIRNSIQTRIYPLLLALNGFASPNNNSIQPQQIEMVYWFTNYPDHPEIIQYSNDQFEADLAYLKDLLHEISVKEIGEFTKTPNTRLCNYCKFRSLCERGDAAGTIDEFEQEILNEPIIDFDISQVGEVEF